MVSDGSDAVYNFRFQNTLGGIAAFSMHKSSLIRGLIFARSVGLETERRSFVLVEHLSFMKDILQQESRTTYCRTGIKNVQVMTQTPQKVLVSL